MPAPLNVVEPQARLSLPIANVQRRRKNFVLIAAGCIAVEGLSYSSLAFTMHDIHQYEHDISISAEKIKNIELGQKFLTIWYKVANNSNKDFDGVDFTCAVFKRDGSFVESSQEGALNVRHGTAVYVEQDIADLDVKDFGRSECRIVMLSTND